jgi:hypothetical protein
METFSTRKPIQNRKKVMRIAAKKLETNILKIFTLLPLKGRWSGQNIEK